MVNQINGGAGVPYVLQWNPGGQSTNAVNNLTAGIYTLTILDNNNCQEVDTFEVTQPAALTVSVNQNGYVLTATVPTGGTPPYSYSWIEQSSPSTSVSTGLTYVVDTYGTYYVEITDANDCEAISTSISYDEGPLATIGLDNMMVSVYPNPFRKEVTVDFGRIINEATIKLVDVYGKLIQEYELANTDKYIIKRTNKASGVYFIEIEIKGVETFKKVILE